MKVFIAIPGYRPIHRMTYWCISELIHFPSIEIKFSECRLKPIAGPDVARSMAASLFLQAGEQQGGEAILFLDDDIVFKTADVMKMIYYLKRGKEIIGGCYVTKSKKPQPTTRFFDDQTVTFGDGTDPVKVMRLAGGFMLCSRKAVQKVADKLPICNSKEDMSFWPMFMPYLKRHGGFLNKGYEYVTEDFAFCDRARDAGFDIWLDPSIRLSHMGEKEYVLEDIFQNGHEPMAKIELKKEKS